MDERRHGPCRVPAPQCTAPEDGKARDRDVHYTAAFRTTDDPPEPELFDLFEEPGGARPVFLTEPPGESQGGAGHGHRL